MQFFQTVFFHLPTITTSRLILRPLKMSDAADMFAYAKDEEVARHVMWDAHKTVADSKAFLRGAKRQYRLGLPASFGIVLRQTGRLVGTIGFMWINTDHKSAEIGYSLAHPLWNQGIMTEALSAVLRFSFETLGLNRVEAQHEADNPASGRVMEKAGMRFEGVMRQRLYNKGRFVDVRLYAILRGDESAHRLLNTQKETEHVQL